VVASNYDVTMQGIMQDELYDMDYPIWNIRYGISDMEYSNMRNEGGVKDGASHFG